MAEIKIIGTQRELFPKHLFLVTIGAGNEFSAGFQKCSELSYEIAKIEYWEGGSIIPWKVPGRVTVADVTLERGASSSRSFYNWCLQVANSTVGSFPTRGVATKSDYYMKPVTVKQMDRDQKNAVATWSLHNTWVTKFVAGDWDNTADEVVIESITLAFDFFRRET